MWPNSQFPADLVTFTEENLNGKLHFLCSGVADNRGSIMTLLWIIYLRMVIYKWSPLIPNDLINEAKYM